MSAYTEFVRAHYKDVMHLKPKERFVAIAKMWADHKAGKTMPAEKKKGGKKVKGGMEVGGLLVGGSYHDDLANSFSFLS
jgi:hypothetical protein